MYKRQVPQRRESLPELKNNTLFSCRLYGAESNVAYFFVDNINKHPLPETEYRADASGPLDDIRVLDLSRLVAGNALTHFLADFGAEVIKVERPGYGDDLRNWRVDGISIHWKVYARNKKSVTLNFRQGKGRELLLELAETAQVLVENFIPGTLESGVSGLKSYTVQIPTSSWSESPAGDKPVPTGDFPVLVLWWKLELDSQQ